MGGGTSSKRPWEREKGGGGGGGGDATHRACAFVQYGILWVVVQEAGHGKTLLLPSTQYLLFSMMHVMHTSSEHRNMRRS